MASRLCADAPAVVPEIAWPGQVAKRRVRIYAALGSNGPVHMRSLQAVDYPFVLVSFAYDKRHTWLPDLGYPLKGMLDSGAYTVIQKGIEIKLDDYIAWAKEYRELIPDLRVTNLDVIPGKRGDYPTKAQRRKAMRQSAENAEAIRCNGLAVVEVHHLLDLPENLERIVETRRLGEVIGLAGLGGGGANKTVGLAYGDSCFSMLRDLNGGWENIPPVHGFGISAPQLGFRWPLASIDASTWASPHRYGQSYDRSRPLGGLVKREGSSEGLRVRDVVVAEQAKLLRDWKRRGEELREHWLSRGVSIEAEGEHLVGG